MVDDARDERYAELLRVEPLDEVTRRRLVASAMRASATTPSNGRLPRIAVAAALVLVVAISGGVLLTQPGSGDGERPTAAPAARSTDPSPQPDGALAPGAPPGAGASTAESAVGDPSADAAVRTSNGAVPYAGDFANLSRAGAEQRMFAALDPTVLAAAGADTVDLGTLLAAFPCASKLPAGTVVAAATGRFGRRDAVIVVTVLADGSRSVDAVVADPCEVPQLG